MGSKKKQAGFTFVEMANRINEAAHEISTLVTCRVMGDMMDDISDRAASAEQLDSALHALSQMVVVMEATAATMQRIKSARDMRLSGFTFVEMSRRLGVSAKRARDLAAGARD